MGCNQSRASSLPASIPANGMTYTRPPSYASDESDTSFVAITSPAEAAMPLHTDDPTDLQPPSNIVLVGSIGSGKSTIINMLAAGAGVSPSPATTSNGALGPTSPICYGFRSRGGKPFRVWDTPGLDEGPKGAVPNEVALEVLHNLLLNQLADDIEGIGLLLFCVHRGLVTESVARNLKLVHEVFCQKEVPICLVVTGLEEEENLRLWWMRPENRAAFSNHGILLNGVACVAATRRRAVSKGKGKANTCDREYEQGKKEVEEAILRNYLAVGWQPRPVEWMRTHPASASEWYTSLVNKVPLYVVDEGIKARLKDIGFSLEQAEELPRRFAAIDVAHERYQEEKY